MYFGMYELIWLWYVCMYVCFYYLSSTIIPACSSDCSFKKVGTFIMFTTISSALYSACYVEEAK